VKRFSEIPPAAKLHDQVVGQRATDDGRNYVNAARIFAPVRPDIRRRTVNESVASPSVICYTLRDFRNSLPKSIGDENKNRRNRAIGVRRLYAARVYPRDKRPISSTRPVRVYLSVARRTHYADKLSRRYIV